MVDFFKKIDSILVDAICSDIWFFVDYMVLVTSFYFCLNSTTNSKLFLLLFLLTNFVYFLICNSIRMQLVINNLRIDFYENNKNS